MSYIGKMARIAAGRSLPQSTIGFLHHQPTPDSVATAEKTLDQGWVPMEAAVAALAMAREADRTGDGSTCQQTVAQAQRAIEATVSVSSPWP